jgi:hypothetical protein
VKPWLVRAEDLAEDERKCGYKDNCELLKVFDKRNMIKMAL